MKKITGIILAATLTTSTLTTLTVEAKTTYKIKSGKLVNAKTGKVVKGFKIYKKVLYKDGKKYNGLRSGKYYKNGKLGSGIYRGLSYKSGKLLDGDYNGIRYEKGILFNGIYNKIKYVDGKEYLIHIERNLFYKSETDTYHYSDGTLFTDMYVDVEDLTEYAYFFTEESKLDSKWTIKDYLKATEIEHKISYGNWYKDEHPSFLEELLSLPDGKYKKQLQNLYDNLRESYNFQYTKAQNQYIEDLEYYLNQIDKIFPRDSYGLIMNLREYASKIDDKSYSKKVENFIEEAITEWERIDKERIEEYNNQNPNTPIYNPYR